MSQRRAWAAGRPRRNAPHYAAAGARHRHGSHSLAPAPYPTPTLPSAGGGVTFKGAQNSAKVVASDLKEGAATAHVIDAVLLPPNVYPSLFAAITTRPDTKQLAALVKAVSVAGRGCVLSGEADWSGAAAPALKAVCGAGRGGLARVSARGGCDHISGVSRGAEPRLHPSPLTRPPAPCRTRSSPRARATPCLAAPSLRPATTGLTATRSWTRWAGSFRAGRSLYQRT